MLVAERDGDKPRLSLKNNTAGVRERSEWSAGPSDIEGKTTRVGASECGQRTSFNRTREAGNRAEVEGIVAITLNGADGVSDIEGKAAREAASECGQRASFDGAHGNGAAGSRANMDGWIREGEASGNEAESSGAT